MDSKTINKLIEAATEQINTCGNGDTSTVGAAALTEDGLIFSSVNFSHFNGGPCAEVSLFARLVSEGQKIPVAIVAIGDRNRGVISPCGRCRQIMIDYYPEIQVVVLDNGERATIGVHELLPYSYVQAIDGA